MKEAELVPIVDNTFVNLGFSIQKEVKFPMVRIDRIYSCGDNQFITEIESDRTSSFLDGIRQLLSIPKNSGSLLLILPLIKRKMIEKLGTGYELGRKIELLDIIGLDKLEEYTIQESKNLKQQKDFENFLNQIVSEIQLLRKKVNDANSTIICEISSNSKKKVKIENPSYITIAGYHGIEEWGSIEWDEYIKRIPFNDLEKLHAYYSDGNMKTTLYGNEKDIELSQSIKNTCYWVFGDLNLVNLQAKLFEYPNIFSIAYDRPHGLGTLGEHPFFTKS